MGSDGIGLDKTNIRPSDMFSFSSKHIPTLLVYVILLAQKAQKWKEVYPSLWGLCFVKTNFLKDFISEDTAIL